MYIKKYSILILFMLVISQVNATSLDGDIITIDGEEWELFGKPMAQNKSFYNRFLNFLPINRCKSKANPEGYTAYWQIKHERLYLDRLEVCIHDSTTQKDSTVVYDVDALKTLFASYYKNGKISAQWMTGIIRAGKGEILRSLQSRYNRNLETEIFVNLKVGKVTKSKVCHNYKKPGLSLREASRKANKQFPWKQFSEYKGKAIGFAISKFKVTEDGKIEDFEVDSIRIYSSRTSFKVIKEVNIPLAIAFKEALKSVYPVETFFINGRYRLEYPSIWMNLQENKIPSYKVRNIKNWVAMNTNLPTKSLNN